ncbi:transketolase family protein [Flectobacillus longus]|uniref:transketolase family protein n=1 Tax=Flectobacillus longus TaxID=2984207 RepID=UPI0024B6B6D5|nr:transketolase C-terminal domain-containing protein [Flectobacillus longus]MDI9879478.1 transketolase C-terminal domain-containing protein [Flectobacillus longus]
MYEELLKNIAIDDERIVVMTAENRALIRNLPSVLGKRFIDTGITEQCMVGAAAGLALRGRVPVLHALASFLSMRAFEFVRTDAGIPNLPIKLSAFIPGFLSDGNGPTHQAVEDVSLMRGIPNMQVFAPANEQDLAIMLPEILASKHPAYIRICHRPTSFQHQKHFEIGKVEVIAEGTDVTLLTYGFMLEQTLIAAEILRAEGKSVGIVNLRSLKPIDEAYLVDLTQKTDLLVTIEDHFVTGGLYSIVAEIFLKKQIQAPVLPIALFEKWFKPARLQEVLEYEGFTGKQIAERILGYHTESIQPHIVASEFAE